MAIVKDNIFLEGLTGTVGNKLTLRRTSNGKTVISRKPKKSDMPLTDEQLEAQDKFKEAASYGKSVIEDPEMKAWYANGKKGSNPYRLAMTDYLRGPKISNIDSSGYTGKAGQEIVIKASDDFKVHEVFVSIIGAEGKMIEQGLAELNNVKTRWIYKTTANNPSLAGDSIVVRVSDLPGNKVEQTKTL